MILILLSSLSDRKNEKLLTKPIGGVLEHENLALGL